MQLEIHGFETLLIVQRISPKQGARCKVGVREPPLGRFIRSWDTVVPVANACTILQYQLTSWGLVYCHPWPENLGWREQGLGLRSSLSQSQGQWLMSLSSREMANPRAGSKAKAHSMAILVTIPVVRASTLDHPTRGSRVLGSSQLNWLCQVHHWRHDWSCCLTQF